MPDAEHSQGAVRPRESVQTLDRGLRVLEVLARPEVAGGLTVAELARELGVGRTVVYRLVETLADHGLVGRAGDGRCRLGMGLTQLAGSLGPRIRASATPTLRRLADEVGATAHLTLLESGEAAAAVVVEPSWTDLHVAYRVGTRHALDEGAAGRAVLAGRAGDLGAVMTKGELQSGAVGVAAPLPPGCGVEGSVGVVSLGELDLASVGPRIVAAAAEVAARLG
ncbi:helix-turn-helix domain-containing protein [Janibacter melonis]|uniref:Helix-turn-helix domain-containing protein n=1 Tax=Janibacter melonis TaxID=262209 RepID=A0A5P8FJM6_9MICO|nr:helix-turn-helix domain-containing protein [Janibacter melonis]QFQ29759.2 helix-turn-helix domain-containing protein [Janibacter melonis]